MASKKSGKIKLIVGLGNPGPRYARTYHNAGRMALEQLAEHLEGGKPKLTSMYTAQKAGSYILVRPKTFMNESGAAVRHAMKFFRVAPEELLVIHDDSDLPLGTGKLQFGRGPAGHRGVISIIEQLGTKDFWRLRLGIRTATGKAEGFVLRPMSAADQKLLYGVVFGTIKKLIENETP